MYHLFVPLCVEAQSQAFADVLEHLRQTTDYNLVFVGFYVTKTIRNRVSLDSAPLPPDLDLKILNKEERLWLRRCIGFWKSENDVVSPSASIPQPDVLSPSSAPGSAPPDVLSPSAALPTLPLVSISQPDVLPPSAAAVPTLPPGSAPPHVLSPSAAVPTLPPSAPPALCRSAQTAPTICASLLTQEVGEQEACCKATTRACLTFLSVKTIAGFTSKLTACELKAHSCRKALSSLISAIRKLSGGPSLSLLTASQRACVRPSIWVLSDAQRSLNRAATIHINQAEGARLLAKARQRLSSKEQLSNLYFLILVEYFALLRCVSVSKKLTYRQAKIWAGYTVLTLLASRPSTRCGVFLALTNQDIAGLSPFQDYHSIVASHKTSANFGCLVLCLPKWATKVVYLFQQFVRPALLEHGDYAQGEEKQLFPARSERFFEAFLKQLPQPVVFTPSLVRKFFADHVGTLRFAPDSKWSKFSQDLVNACAHTSTGLVGKHYHTSNKTEQEKLLAQFVHEEFFEPAMKRVQTLSGQDELPEFDFSSLSVSRNSAPVRSKRKRALRSQREPDERVCHNKAKKKRCLSGNQPAIFDSEADVCCSACIQGYKYNGNLHTLLFLFKSCFDCFERRRAGYLFVSPVICSGKCTPKRAKLLTEEKD